MGSYPNGRKKTDPEKQSELVLIKGLKDGKSINRYNTITHVYSNPLTPYDIESNLSIIEATEKKRGGKEGKTYYILRTGEKTACTLTNMNNINNSQLQDRSNALNIPPGSDGILRLIDIYDGTNKLNTKKQKETKIKESEPNNFGITHIDKARYTRLIIDFLESIGDIKGLRKLQEKLEVQEHMDGSHSCGGCTAGSCDGRVDEHPLLAKHRELTESKLQKYIGQVQGNNLSRVA